MDTVDTILWCIRLQWHQTPGEKRRLPDAPEFGSIPISVIRGVVHTLRKISSGFQTYRSDPRVISYHQICDETKSWQNKLFYANRFYYDRTKNLILNLKVELQIHMHARTFKQNVFVIGLISVYIYIKSSAQPSKVTEINRRMYLIHSWMAKRTLWQLVAYRQGCFGSKSSAVAKRDAYL